MYIHSFSKKYIFYYIFIFLSASEIRTAADVVSVGRRARGQWPLIHPTTGPATHLNPWRTTQHPAPTAPRLNPLLPCCVTSLLTFNVFVFGVTSDMLCLCLCRFHSNCLRILSSDCFPRPATNCWGWVRVRVPKKGWCTYKNVGWVQKVAYNCINMQISEPKRGGDGWPALTHCRPQCQRVSPDRQTAAAHLPLSTLSQHS